MNDSDGMCYCGIDDDVDDDFRDNFDRDVEYVQSQKYHLDLVLDTLYLDKQASARYFSYCLKDIKTEMTHSLLCCRCCYY